MYKHILYRYIYIYIYIIQARERYQNLSKEEKKSHNVVINVTKVS